ncbi:hypothetical protein D3C84_1182700 [compost metagenome]
MHAARQIAGSFWAAVRLTGLGPWREQSLQWGFAALGAGAQANGPPHGRLASGGLRERQKKTGSWKPMSLFLLRRLPTRCPN